MTAITLTNSTNLACHLTSTSGTQFDSLAFFTDLHAPFANKRRVCECKRGKLGDLPIVADVSIFLLGISADSVLERLTNYPESHQLAPGVGWSLEGSLLRVDVDMAKFPDMIAAKAPGHAVTLLRLNKPVAPIMMVTLMLEAEGGALWPSLASPGRAVSSVRDNSEALTPSRRLVMDGQTPMDDLCRRSDLDGGAAFFGEALFVDPTDHNAVRVVFYPNNYDGNVFTTDLYLHEVVVKLIIEYLDEDDPRVRRARAARPGAPRRGVERNVRAEEGRDGARDQPIIVLTFDADADLGPIELDEMFQSAGSKGSRAVLVAECKTLCGNLDVRLTATRAGLDIPSEKEVYVAVRSFLAPVGKDFGGVDLREVGDFVFQQYPYLARASQEQQQTLRQTVWGCARLYMINTMMDLPETIAEDDVLQEILPSR